MGLKRKPLPGWLMKAVHDLRLTHDRYPETPPNKMPGRYRALVLRRAKNRVARASRKVNRG